MVRRIAIVFGAGLLLPLVAVQGVASAAAPSEFTASLSGAQEVPPTPSPATGSGKVILSADEATITVALTFSGLSSPATTAAIHDAPAGTNGPATFILSGFPTATSGSFQSGSLAITSAQVTELKAGNFYFNIHDAIFPGGEIRGQLALAPTADLAVTNSVSASTTAGTNATYTITLTNNGGSAASSATLSDTTPAGTTFVSMNQTSGPAFTVTAPASGGTGSVTATIASLANGASAQFQLVLHVGSNVASGTVISDKAAASTSTTDPDSSNNTSDAATTISTSADVAIAKTGPASAPAGSDVTYHITVTNHGPSDAQSVTSSDTLPSHTSLVSFVQDTGPANGGRLPAGGTQTFTLVLHIDPTTTAGTVLTDTADVSSTTSDSNTANNESKVNTTVATLADLGVTKTGPAAAVPGTNLTYTITVTNGGPSDAHNALLTDAVPAGTTFVSVAQTAGPGFTCTHPPVGSGGSISCSIATLANGATATFSVVVHDGPSPGTITNTAHVSSDTSDTATGNNTSSVTTSGGCDHTVSGTQSGAMQLSGGSWCVTGATINGPLTVSSGTTAVIANTTVNGPITATSPASFSLCGSSAAGNVGVSGATGFVLLGDPGDDSCAADRFAAAVNLSSNHAGVEISHASHIGGNLTVSGNNGGGPFDDASPEVEANVIGAGLACPGNSPAASDDHQPNSVGGPRSGDCAPPGF